MSDIQKGRTFTDTPPGNTVTATDLNRLVDDATILPAFVGEKPAAAPDPADSLLVYQASTAQFVRASVADLLALVPAAPAPPALSIIVGGNAPGPAYQSADCAWISTGIDSAGGLLLWNAASGAWEPAGGPPRLSIVRYGGDTSAPYFSASGLGAQGRWRGWALCNGQNGTPDLNTATEKYLQLLL